MIQTISFIGSGNVATHLAKALYAKDFQIKQVFSRKLANAEVLANQVGAQAIHELSLLTKVDLLIISVPDDAIASVIKSLSLYQGLVAHTSGITGITFNRERVGYFYPLQSFRKHQAIDFFTTPMFVKAKQEQDEKDLLQLAQAISNNAKIVSQEQKEKLHLGAVFVNNYVNHLFGLTNEFLSDSGLDFSDLQPIIQTTIQRALQENPFDIQTGPALRNDGKTLAKHRELLTDYPEMKEVYNQLALSIQRQHNESTDR